MMRLGLLLVASTMVWISAVQADFFEVASISSSGMSVQRAKMDIIAENIANIDTIITENGEPYRRQSVAISPGGLGIQSVYAPGAKLNGAKVLQVTQDRSPFRQIYQPGNPYADANGFVLMPNVNSTQEMIQMMGASRAFEANIQVFEASRRMALRAINSGR